MRRPRSLLETRSSTSISFTWTLSGLALAACGGGGGSSSGPVVASYNITVYDGPISGASIYVDENENGLIDAGDTSLGKTDGRGIISVPKTAENKHLIAHLEGAVDSDNPDVILGDILWRAPVGSAVISPLTELVVEAGDEASVLLEELGLKGVDVSSINPFDPLDPNPQGASDTVKVAAQMVAGIIDDDGASSLLASLRHALDNKPTGFSLSAIEKTLAEGSREAEKLADIPITDDALGTNTPSIGDSDIFDTVLYADESGEEVVVVLEDFTSDIAEIMSDSSIELYDLNTAII